MKNIIKVTVLSLGLASSPAKVKVIAGEEIYTTESPLTTQEIRARFTALHEENIISKDKLAAEIAGNEAHERNHLNEQYSIEFPESETGVIKITTIKLLEDPVEIDGRVTTNIFCAKYQGMYLRIYFNFVLPRTFELNGINFAKLQSAGCYIDCVGAARFRRNGSSFRLPLTPEVIVILKSEYKHLGYYDYMKKIQALTRIWEAADKAGIEAKEYTLSPLPTRSIRNYNIET